MARFNLTSTCALFFVMMIALLFFVSSTIAQDDDTTPTIQLFSTPTSVDERFGALVVSGVIDCTDVTKPVCDGSHVIKVEFKANDAQCIDAKTAKMFTSFEFIASNSGSALLKQTNVELLPDEDNLTTFANTFKLAFSPAVDPSITSSIRFAIQILSNPAAPDCINDSVSFTVFTTLAEQDTLQTIADASTVISTTPSISTALKSVISSNTNTQYAVINVGPTEYESPRWKKKGSIVMNIADIDTSLLDLKSAPLDYKIALFPTGIYQTVDLTEYFHELECIIFNTFTVQASLTTIGSTKAQYYSIPLRTADEEPRDYASYQFDQLTLKCDFAIDTAAQRDALVNLHLAADNLAFAVVFPRFTSESRENNVKQDSCIDWTADISKCTFTTFTSTFYFKTLFNSYPVDEARANVDGAYAEIMNIVEAYADRMVPIDGDSTKSRFIYDIDYINSHADQFLSKLFTSFKFVADDADDFVSGDYNLICNGVVESLPDRSFPFTVMMGSLTTVSIESPADTILPHSFKAYHSTSWTLVPTQESFATNPFGSFDPNKVTCETYILRVSLEFKNANADHHDEEPSSLPIPSLVVFIGNEQYRTRTVPDYKDMIYTPYALYAEAFSSIPTPVDPKTYINVDSSEVPDSNGAVTFKFLLDLDDSIYNVNSFSVVIPEVSGVRTMRFYIHNAQPPFTTTRVLIGGVETIARFNGDSGLTVDDTKGALPAGGAEDSIVIEFPDIILLLQNGQTTTEESAEILFTALDIGLDKASFFVKQPTATDDYDEGDDDVSILSWANDVPHGVLSNFTIKFTPTVAQKVDAKSFSISLVGDGKDFTWINHGQAVNTPLETTNAVFADGTRIVGTFSKTNPSVITFDKDVLLAKGVETLVIFETLTMVRGATTEATHAPSVAVTVPEWAENPKTTQTDKPTRTADWLDVKNIITSTHLDDKHGFVTLDLVINTTPIATPANTFTITLDGKSVRPIHHKQKTALTTTTVKINNNIYTADVLKNGTEIVIRDASIPLNTAKVAITFPNLILLATSLPATASVSQLTIPAWAVTLDTQVPAPTIEKDYSEGSDGMSGVAKFFLVIFILAAIGFGAFVAYKLYQRHLQRKASNPETHAFIDSDDYAEMNV